MTRTSSIRRVAAVLVAVTTVVAVVLAVVWLTHRGPTEASPTAASADPSSGSPTGSASGSPSGSPSEPGGVPTDVRRLSIDWFTASGSWLTLSYTAGLLECSGTGSATAVVQTDESVTVTLALPPRSVRSKACLHVPAMNTVTVHLDRPLGGREVRDDAYSPPRHVPRLSDLPGPVNDEAPRVDARGPGTGSR